MNAPPGRDRRQWVRDSVETLLSAAGLPDPQDGPVDDRWEWAAPLLLDPELRSFLEAWRDGDIPALEGDEPLPRPNPELFGAYVDDLLNLPIDQLGRRPPGLVDLLTEVAPGAPAILALRSLDASPDLAANTRRRLAVTIADAFWSLFNQPAVISLMRQLSAGKKTSRDDTAYLMATKAFARFADHVGLKEAALREAVPARREGPDRRRSRRRRHQAEHRPEGARQIRRFPCDRAVSPWRTGILRLRLRQEQPGESPPERA